VLWVEGTLLDELNWSDRFGNRLDRFGLFVQRNRSDRFHNRLDWFVGSRVTSLVFVVVMRLGSGPLVVVQMFGMVSLVVVNLLDVLPPRAKYDGKRSHSFEMERRNGPRSSFCGFCSPLARQGWFPSGGSRGGSFDRCGDLVCANPTLEQMARHWFYSFDTNPSVELFVHSRACF
jgi:hypothetical protein